MFFVSLKLRNEKEIKEFFDGITLTAPKGEVKTAIQDASHKLFNSYWSREKNFDTNLLNF